MKKLLLVLLLLLAAPAIAAAQQSVTPANGIAWDHDGQTVDRFQLGVDGVFVDIPGGAGVRQVRLPAMTPGVHVLAVKTCLAADCAASTDFPVRMVIVVAPDNLRIVSIPLE